jgi:hypothetical protein
MMVHKQLMFRLQVFTDGEWGTLNTCGPFASEEDIKRAQKEMAELQSRWSSQYGRYRDATFRILTTAR